MKKTRYIIGGLLMVIAVSTAQEKETKTAAQNFDNLAYADAIENYQELIDKGYSEEDIFKKLGDANYQNAKYKEASEWYGKLMNLENASFDADYIYRYAQSLKSTKDYEASNLWMQKYLSSKGNESRAAKIANNSDYLADIETQSGRYNINTISVNSSASDFAPAIMGEELIFSTARDSGITSRKIHSWNNQPFTNLYKATNNGDGNFGEPTKLFSLNKKTHETSAVFTKDGSTVYFTRNNSVNGRFARDNEGVSRLKLFKATLNNGDWANITELPFNSDDYSTAHPALSADERTLYFASDMPGTNGQSDIFTVTINEDGSFGTPKNLGNQINTEGRETFPFVSANNILYFASDGHPGLGGLDVFATSIKDMNKVHIVNVGKPLNTEQDDFAFIINDETKKGYFTSNREGGKGDDDIYSFVETEPIDVNCNTVIAGVVKDKKDGSTIAGANIVLVDADGTTIANAVSTSNGSFILEGECSEGNYKVMGASEGYEPAETSFATLYQEDKNDVEVVLTKLIQKAPLGADLAKFLDFEPVYFDYDKWFIRPDAKISLEKILAYLNEYPSTKIQIGSHTDSRASKAYNTRLSNKRANATMEYLIEKGIAADRMKALGFGETMLTNDCADRVICSDDKHQENRRSEFIVIEQ